MSDQPDTAASAADRGAGHSEEPETRVLINSVDCLAKTGCFIWTDVGA